MTITITQFSGYTDNAPASPAYFNSKMSEAFSAITALNVNLPWTTSGATVTGDTGYYFTLPSLDSGGFGYNLRAFPLSSGTDYAAVLRSALSVANGGTLLIPQGTYYLGSTVTLSAQIKMFGAGGQGTTSFIKTHGGNMFDVTVANVEVHNLDFEGDTTHASAASAGWAFNLTGGANVTNFKFLNCAINSLVSGINFADDTGGGSVIANGRIAPFTGVAGGEGVAVQAGSDTGARQRFISNMNMPGGYISLTSTNDTFISNSALKRVDIGASCFGTHVQGCRLGNSSSTFTVDGNTTNVVGNAISGTVVLPAAFDGVYAGNVHSGGSVINNSTAANVLIVDPYHYKMASGGSFDLNTSRFLSIRTLALTSLTSANLQPFELAIGYGASGSSLAFRSGGTVWYPNSSLSTVG